MTTVKRWTSFFVQLIIAFFVVIAIILFMAEPILKGEEESLISYEQDWKLTFDGETSVYDVLPDKIEGNALLGCEMTKELPANLMDENYLIFFSAHQEVHVYAKDELLYALEVPENSISKTVGCGWIFVPINNRYSGETLRVVLNPVYSGTEITLPRFEFGDKGLSITRKIQKKSIAICVCFCMILFGIILVTVWLFSRDALRGYHGILWLGTFSMALGFWSLLETQIIQILFGHEFLWNQCSFIIIKLALIPVIRFVEATYGIKESRVFNVLCSLCILDMIGTSILQFMRVADYRESNVLTLLLYASTAVWILVYTVRLLIKKERQSEKARRVVWMHAFCLGVVATTVIVQIVFYSTVNPDDSSVFIRYGVFFYIVLITVSFLNNSLDLLQAGEKMEHMEEVATRDALTKLRNRTVFERDMYELDGADDKSRYGIAMFDLNNLKKFNDKLGHSMGDYYIIVCSEIIQDVFGERGNVYRTGGDEFCAVMKGVAERNFHVLEKEMNARLEAINGKFFDERMEIASGYAVYDAVLDQSMQDTCSRADKAMYVKKTEMKRRALETEKSKSDKGEFKF